MHAEIAALVKEWRGNASDLALLHGDVSRAVTECADRLEALLADLARVEEPTPDRLADYEASDALPASAARALVARLGARREHQRKLAEAAHKLYLRFGKEDEDVMDVWSLAVIDPEPPTSAELTWARSQIIASADPVRPPVDESEEFDPDRRVKVPTKQVWVTPPRILGPVVEGEPAPAVRGAAPPALDMLENVAEYFERQATETRDTAHRIKKRVDSGDCFTSDPGTLAHYQKNLAWYEERGQAIRSAIAALRSGGVALPPPDVEICICAAWIAMDGRIFRGHRHNHCRDAMVAAGCEPLLTYTAQGFITSRNRFVDRDEGARLQEAAHIKSVDPNRIDYPSALFSEDLY